MPQSDTYGADIVTIADGGAQTFDARGAVAVLVRADPYGLIRAA